MYLFKYNLKPAGAFRAGKEGEDFEFDFKYEKGRILFL